MTDKKIIKAVCKTIVNLREESTSTLQKIQKTQHYPKEVKKKSEFTARKQSQAEKPKMDCGAKKKELHDIGLPLPPLDTNPVNHNK